MNAHASSPYTIKDSPTPFSKQPPVTAISRQPIYDREQRLYAYRLMTCISTRRTRDEEEPSHHTAELICSAFIEGGLDKTVGPYQAILPLSRGLLIMDYALVLPADRVILEVAALTLPDAALIEAARDLAAQGYSLTLKTHRDMVALHPLLEAVNLITIDLQAWSLAELRDHVAQCRQYDARLLADHVNTPDDITRCQDLGIDYLQGAVFGPADTLEWHRSPTYRSSWLHLMTYLINPMANMDMIETVMRHDLALTYKLLRLVHAGFCDRRPPITSMRQVLQTIGMRALITWVSFVLLSDFDDTPHEMANTAAVRAHMCEFLAQAEGLPAIDTFFLIGLLSGLDALLDRPMSELLDTLPLHDDIRHALQGRSGDFSRIFSAVLAYEQGRWDDIQALAIDSSTITDSYLQAIVRMESRGDVK